jgi:hypothetical protein
MSLYNRIFGYNPFAFELLGVIGIEQPNIIPRFRDCFVDVENRLVIFTRTGGSNRPYYEDEESARLTDPDWLSLARLPSGFLWNAGLRAFASYIEDVDDKLDRTFALFRYATPEHFKDRAMAIQQAQGWVDPMERFRKMMRDLTTGNDTAEVRRALEVGKELMNTIQTAPSGVTVVKI